MHVVLVGAIPAPDEFSKFSVAALLVQLKQVGRPPAFQRRILPSLSPSLVSTYW